MESDRLLCAGPGRLTQALGIDRSMNGADLVAGVGLWLRAGRPVARDRVGVSTRVGISVARERPWRFFEAGSAFVSRRAATSATVKASARARATVKASARAKDSEKGSGTVRGSALEGRGRRGA
jgi:Methylpurine-DNA glycosylase (MPG)